MNVKVIKDLCIGCGNCVYTCDEVFEMNDEGFAQVKEGVDVTPFIEDVKIAMDSCPTSAIVEVDE